MSCFLKILATRVATTVYLLACICAAFYYLVNNLDSTKWPADLYWHYSVLTVPGLLCFWATYTAAWRTGLRVTTSLQITWKVSLQHASMLLLGKYLPGKVWGMFARERDLVRRFGNRVTPQVVKASYFEQLVTLHTGFLLVPLMFKEQLQSISIGGLSATVVALAMLVPLINNILATGGGQLFKNRVEVLSNSLRAAYIGYGNYLILMFVYLLQWIVLGLIFIAVYLAVVGELPGFSGLVELFGLCALSMLAGFLAVFAPGGVGVREGVVVYFLNGSIGLESALAISLVWRVVMMAGDLLFGAAVFYFSHINKGVIRQ